MFDQTPRSPLLPQTTLSLDERLAAYDAKFQTQENNDAAQMGGEQKQVDPFMPQLSKTVDPEERQQEVDKWIAPVSADVSIPKQTRTGADYDHFQNAVMEDPAIKELMPALMGDEQNPGLAPYLQSQIQSGAMSYNDALEHASKFMDEHFAPILDKHHGHMYDTTKPRTYFKARDVANEMGISTQAIASGAKSPSDLKIGGA